MIRLIIIGAALLLAGCQNQAALDGYVFENKQTDRSSVYIKKQEYKSFSSLRAALPDNMSRDWKDKHVAEGAWGELHADGSCTIHFIDPTVKYQPQWIGHEAAHCFYGQWHD